MFSRKGMICKSSTKGLCLTFLLPLSLPSYSKYNNTNANKIKTNLRANNILGKVLDLAL
jgi:hypothetical protein